MTVVRREDFYSTPVTLVAATPLQVTLVRPTSGKVGNTIDHVVSPYTRRDYNAGRLMIDLSAVPVGTLVTKVERVRDEVFNFTEPPVIMNEEPEPLFPSGVSPSTVEVIMDVAVGVLFSVASLVSFLDNLYIGAEEVIRITLLNPAPGVGVIRHAYDFGRSRADMPLRG